MTETDQERAEQQAAEQALRALIDALYPVDPTAGLDDVPDVPAAQPANRRLIEKLDSLFAAPTPPMPLDQARAVILQTLHDYANRKGGFRLLVAAPAGTGKSHQAIQFVQERAEAGERWLWAAQNHAMFEDLKRQKNFKPELWQHWQAMDGEIDGEPACRFAEAQRRWTEKGYRARNLCYQLCNRKHNRHDDEEVTWMDTCPFRTQGQRQSPIVFCMHQHLFTGVDAGRFNGIIIDESFIALIARERYIPGRDLKQANIDRKVIDFSAKLTELWNDVVTGMKGPHLSGRALLNELAEAYPEVIQFLQDYKESPTPVMGTSNYLNPLVTDKGQIDALQTVYMLDLTVALFSEYQAWKAWKAGEGLDHWAERVWIDRDGLHFVTPAQMWGEMPKKVIVLDATGYTSFIQYAMRGAVEEYRPNLALAGHIYQVTARTNGKGQVVERKRAKNPKGTKKFDTAASADTLEFIAIVRELVKIHGYKNIAVVCAYDAEKFIKAELGLDDDHIMHFYKLRGRNDLQDVDALFVYGTPTPGERTVTNIMLALDPKRTEPIFDLDEDGNHRPIYVPMEREFRLSEAGLAQFQAERGEQYHGAARVVGCYKDHVARSIQGQMRESELLQAVYRARPITNPADVWIFSSVPLDLPLDGLYDDPPIAPKGVNWKLWLKILAWCDDRRTRTNEPLTLPELAEGVGVSVDHLKHLDMLQHLKDYYQGEIVSIRLDAANVNKGRKNQAVKMPDLPNLHFV